MSSIKPHVNRRSSFRRFSIQSISLLEIIFPHCFQSGLPQGKTIVCVWANLIFLESFFHWNSMERLRETQTYLSICSLNKSLIQAVYQCCPLNQSWIRAFWLALAVTSSQPVAVTLSSLSALFNIISVDFGWLPFEWFKICIVRYMIHVMRWTSDLT